MSRHVFEGPDRYWSPDLPVSRGQWATVAALALALLDIPQPATRLDASNVIARLHEAHAEQPAGEPPPPRCSEVVSVPPLAKVPPARLLAARRAIEAVPLGAVADLVDRVAEERCARSVRRRHRSGPHTLRCRLCNRFIRSLGTPCGSCGFHQ